MELPPQSARSVFTTTDNNNASVDVTSVTRFQQEHMTNDMSLIAGYYMIVVCVIGTVENVTVLITFRRHPNLRFISSDLVQILCVFDILMVLCAFPFIVTSCIANRWLFSDIGCQWYGFTMTAIGIGSISTLACIALERYIVITSVQHDTRAQGTRMKKIAIVCIVHGILAGLMPFFGVGRYDHEPVFLSCTPAWWSRERSDVAFIMTIFTLAFIVPVSIIVFSYTGICIKVFSMKSGHRRKRQYIKMTVMSFLMVAFFLLSWGPYAIFAFIQSFVSDYNLTAIENMIPVMMAKSCVIWNPIIYVGGNEHFRNMLKNDLAQILNMCRSIKVRKKRQPDHIADSGIGNSSDNAGEENDCDKKCNSNYNALEGPISDKYGDNACGMPPEKASTSQAEEGDLPKKVVIWTRIKTNNSFKTETMKTSILNYDIIQIETCI